MIAELDSLPTRVSEELHQMAERFLGELHVVNASLAATINISMLAACALQHGLLTNQSEPTSSPSTPSDHPSSSHPHEMG